MKDKIKFSDLKWNLKIPIITSWILTIIYSIIILLTLMIFIGTV